MEVKGSENKIILQLILQFNPEIVGFGLRKMLMSYKNYRIA